MIFKCVFVFIFLWYNVESKCAMRSVCATVNGSDKNCPYDGDPLPVLEGLSPELTEEIREHLINRCPQLVFDDEGNQKPDNEILTCCDYKQVILMSESLLLSDGVLGRCPTCARNFVRQICEMSCAPDQARFLDVHTETSPDGVEYVDEIDYRMHEDFMIGAHASCAGVIVPQTGIPAINLMCGDAPVCDAEAWFGFTGDISQNPLTPVQINFLKWPTAEDSMNAPAPYCNETNYDDLPCSCMDCVAMCPVGSQPIPDEMCTIWSINCYSFGVSVIIVVLTIVTVALLSRVDYRKTQKNAQNKPQPLKKEPRANAMTRILQGIFSKIGSFSASNPLLVLIATSWLLFFMLYGAINVNLTTNPLELWSAPDSRSRAEFDYYNSRFGPFYRASQVFLRFTGLPSFTVNNQTFGPAYNVEALQELVKLEDAIINIGRDDNGVKLEQVCYAPLRLPGSEQRLDQCVSMSAATYLGENRNDINNNTYLTQIQSCLNNYLSQACMAPWGGGSEPELSMGGYDDDILSADTLLINFPLSNHLFEEDLEPVLAWEAKFIELLQDYEANWKPDFIDVSFGTERSIEDEIARVTSLEAVPMIISYFLMFGYVTVALGNIRSFKTCLIDSKIIVAIASIFVVLASIVSAIGVMSFANVTMSLLAINVVPFFVLSVGIDNVFLMINTLDDLKHKLKEFDGYNENMSFNKKRAFLFEKMLGKVAPSMFVSSITQVTCFAIGSLAKFPAVVTFAGFVSISLGFLFLFQITTVVAILSIDFKRTYQNRFDVFCCIRKKVLNDSDPLNSDKPYESVISKVMEPYAKILLTWWVKIIVILAFVAMLCSSIILIPRIEVGLDQQMALPPDSYVYKYLQSVNELMKMGPPVFFVLKSGLNFTDPYHQNVICGGQVCYEDSLNTQIFLAAQYPEITYISKSSNSWLDDFFDWSGLQGACCKYNTTDGSFCRSVDTSPDCAFCNISRLDWNNGLRPSPEAFEHYIPLFLLDDPTEICNKGGLASYYGSVNYVLDSEGRATVQDTSFMAYHSTLSTSEDYITAVKYAYEVSENITAAIQKHTGLDVEVFPYSVFYVYYEQYLTMWRDTFAFIGYCLIGACVLNLLASGFNFLTTFAVMSSTVMVLLNMMGVMYIWNIPLNAVSCINLIVSIGIAVEFCSHIAYAFATSSCPKEERVADALKSVGSTIITGITFTNIPIVVLAFSYTEMIEVFFFRMLFSIVVLGFMHGMIFLPVFLSYLSTTKYMCSK